MYRGKRRYGLQAQMYATNPWALIQRAIDEYCPKPCRSEAQALLAQAHFFYDAVERAQDWAAKPLLLYYSVMNLAKSYILTRQVRTTLDQARHGISERLDAGQRELLDAYLDAFPFDPAKPNVFADFWEAVSGYKLPAKRRLDITALLPQVVVGHRIWADAADEDERFISVERIRLLDDPSAKALWLVIQLHASTLTQQGVGHAELLKASGLNLGFRDVKAVPDGTGGEWFVQFEQRTPITYAHRPSDSIPDLIEPVRQHLWAAVTTARPFREYYLYRAPASEQNQVLPQLISIYALTFYFGSITRYRPQHFDALVSGEFGAQVQEFLTSQPSQFLYLLASDFARRDITRPSLA